MKCAFVNLGKHYGGAEKYLNILIEAWMNEGNEAIVIVRKDKQYATDVKKNFAGTNISVVEVTFSLLDIIKTRRILESKKIDIINIHGINSGFFINLMNLDIPTVTTVHSNAEFDRRDKAVFVRKFFLILEYYLLQRTRKIIVVSEAIKLLLIARGIDQKKIEIISNGISALDYNGFHVRKDYTAPLRICFVGRLERVKGCEYLIRAIEKLQDYPLTCDIYGEGTEKNDLVELATNIGVKDKISFQGFCSDIRSKLPSYDVLVLPSLYEAFPLTILEAMNAKVLLVCSDVGGIPFVIENGKNGLLFACKNTDKLAEILKYVLNNPDEIRVIVEKAYLDFYEHYTKEKMISRTINAICQVLS